jgi:hypothetical protein
MNKRSLVKEGKVFETPGLVNQANTLPRKAVLKLLKGVKGAIDDSFIRELPKEFRRLEFRGIRR